MSETLNIFVPLAASPVAILCYRLLYLLVCCARFIAASPLWFQVTSLPVLIVSICSVLPGVADVRLSQRPCFSCSCQSLSVVARLCSRFLKA